MFQNMKNGNKKVATRWRAKYQCHTLWVGQTFGLAIPCKTKMGKICEITRGFGEFHQSPQDFKFSSREIVDVGGGEHLYVRIENESVEYVH